MGNKSSAQSEINNLVESVLKVYSEFSQSCATTAINSNEFIIKAKGDVSVSNLNIDQFAQVNTKCLQDVVNNTKVEQKIKELIKNSAEAITGALAIASKADTNTVTNNVTNLVTEIKNTYKQSCIGNAMNENVFEFESTDGKVTVNGINIKQYSNSLTDCVQKIVANSEAKAELDQSIDNSAKSTVKGLEDMLGSLLLLLALGLVAYLVLSSGVGSALGKGNIFMIVLLCIIGYCIAAYTWNGFPYWFMPEKSRKPIFITFICVEIVIALILMFRMFKGK